MSVSRCTVPRRIACLAAALLPLVLATAGQASASSVCERLRARLAAPPPAFSSNANLRDFTGAISRQNLELRRAKNEHRRMGCRNDSVIYIDNGVEAACTELEDTIARMEGNLRQLKAQRQELISNGNDDARRRVLAAMDINGCLAAPDDDWNELDDFATTTEEDIHRNILRDLSPESDDYPLLFERPAMEDFPPMEGNGNGPFRTMCVRTCDGAFFPISSNATPADFARDTELCRARCPTADTELYYHVLATEESDQMVSASTGRPYSELPTAFAYRTREVRTPGTCGCQIPKLATAEPDRQSAPAARLSAVSPSVMTIEGAQRENAATGTAGVSSAAEERPYDPKNSKVRLVGPTFLPREESAIDLKNPQGPRYQPLQDD